MDGLGLFNTGCSFFRPTDSGIARLFLRLRADHQPEALYIKFRLAVGSHEDAQRDPRRAKRERR